MKSCKPLWRKAHFQVKMYKAPELRNAFGSCDVEKVHAVVARSTFASEKAKGTSHSEHFWKLQCRKSARRCGAKHMSKSKCKKHTMPGSLWNICRKVHAIVARSRFPSQNAQSISVLDDFWTFRCRFAWQAQGIGHLVKSEQNVTVL